MACFKDKTKKQCSYFVLLVSMILLIMGTVVGYYGFSQLGSEKIQEMQSDYASIKVSQVLPIIALATGGVILITGILGFFTALCRNSGINCLFATPFMIFAFLGAIVLFVLAAIASGADGAVMEAKNTACEMDIGDGVILDDKVSTEYTKLVDKNMCSAVCSCPLNVADTWNAVPMNRTRLSGRVAADLMTAEEQQDVIERGPYDADVTPLVFSTPNVKTYTQCYNENLKPLFET